MAQSLDVSFQSLNKPVAYGSAWLGLPIPCRDYFVGLCPEPAAREPEDVTES